MTPSLGWVSIPSSFVSLFIFYILSYLLSKTISCLSGCLMSSANIQKLFCGICSAFKLSFNEFVGEKVVSPFYSSTILGPLPLWKILKDMGIPEHLICLMRYLCAGQEATVRTGHGTTDWFQIGKEMYQGYILSPCLFNLHAECIMRNTRLVEAQAGIKIAGEISDTSDI